MSPTFRKVCTAAAVALIPLGALAACGSSGSESSFGSLADLRDAITAKGYACKADVKPYRASEDEVDVGVKPVREVVCTIDGRQVDLTEFASAADRQRAVQILEGLVCSFGDESTEVVFASEGPYLISSDGNSAADRRLIERIAAAIDVETKTVTCKGKAGTATTENEASGKTTTTEATTTTAAEPAKPADARASNLLQGNASPPLPAGGPGGIAVIATGSSVGEDGSLPVVVRNNTTSVAYDIEATGRARQGAQLVGSGESQGFQPASVQPGEVAIGYVYFGDAMPTGATFEVSPSAKDAVSEFGPTIGLPVSERNVTAGEFGSQIVGTVTSPLDHAVDSSASVLAMCFDEAGKPLSSHSGYTDGESIAAKGSASFAIDLIDEPCPTYLVGASVIDY